jgi:hypothetical protein
MRIAPLCLLELVPGEETSMVPLDSSSDIPLVITASPALAFAELPATIFKEPPIPEPLEDWPAETTVVPPDEPAPAEKETRPAELLVVKPALICTLPLGPDEALPEDSNRSPLDILVDFPVDKPTEPVVEPDADKMAMPPLPASAESPDMSETFACEPAWTATLCPSARSVLPA